MKRQDLLYPYIDACRDKPFAWGSWDCCQFVGEWILTLTGSDLRAKFPAYDTEEQALAILTEHGGLPGLLSSLPQIHKSRACEGDLVLSNGATGAELGICLGIQSAFLLRPKGLAFLPTFDAVMAWRIE
jgi:hypothetical protein